MAYDPYTSDSGYLRFHLVRMVAEKLPPFQTTEEVIGLLEALSAYVSRGSTPPDEEDETPIETNNTTTLGHLPGGGYI